MYGSQRDEPKWNERDRELIVGHALYEQSLCSGCAQDRQRSMNPDMLGYYEVQTFECFACAALDEHRDKAEHKPGATSQKEFVLDTGPADGELRPWVLRLIASDDADDQHQHTNRPNGEEAMAGG